MGSPCCSLGVEDSRVIPLPTDASSTPDAASWVERGDVFMGSSCCSTGVEDSRALPTRAPDGLGCAAAWVE